MRGYTSRAACGVVKGLMLLLTLGLSATWAGCTRWHYRPPIPTDYVGWRYSQHNFFRKHFSRSSTSHGSGNYRVIVTTTHQSMSGGGRRVLRIPDLCPPVSRANEHILRVNQKLLSMPFVSVDGVSIDQPGEAVPIGASTDVTPPAPSGVQ